MSFGSKTRIQSGEADIRSEIPAFDAFVKCGWMDRDLMNPRPRTHGKTIKLVGRRSTTPNGSLVMSPVSISSGGKNS